MIYLQCLCDFCKRPLPIIRCIDPNDISVVLGHKLRREGWTIVGNDVDDPDAPDLLICKECLKSEPEDGEEEE